MALAEPIPAIRKRRKRRRPDKAPVSARLVLNDHVKDEIGLLSEDLFADLFPSLAHVQEESPVSSRIHHVAISPGIATQMFEDTSWTIVPVKPSSALASSTVQFSPSSLALQRFAGALQKLAPSKLSSHNRDGIEVRILDIFPLPLEVVFVTIEGDIARRLGNGEGTLHGDFIQSNGTSNGMASSTAPEDRLSAAIRAALGALKVIHSDDFFSLPLPPHPITHALPPPAKVTHCEPLGQGILSPSSKIIITQTAHGSRNFRKPHSLTVARSIIDEDEDTSNDQFYSAAEERDKTDNLVENDQSAAGTETELSEADNDDLSDDSLDDMIALQVPMLPSHNASGLSTAQAGTPQTIGRGRKNDAIHTPGSVVSSYTATTVRAGGQKGRLFKTQGLLQRMPEEMLHPRPIIGDDDEARVFVDINSLTRIGCFSGDWVRLEAAPEPPSQSTGLWGLGSFGASEPEEPLWRPVKIFGLPESFSHRPTTKILSKKHDGRRTSFFESQLQRPSNLTAYLPPILLANMENTPYCRISPLKRDMQAKAIPVGKITSASRPPFARELTLLKISTPFTTERPLQNALFTGLKQHFASHTRSVSKGDLVGIAIDENLARTLHQPISIEDPDVDELLSEATPVNDRLSQSKKPTGVAWFRISYIGIPREATKLSEADEIWGGTASIDASSTRILQSGSQVGRLPGTLENTWEYYLGLKSIPKSVMGHSAILGKPQHHVTALQRRVRGLIAAATSPRAINLHLKPLAILLVSTQRNIGKLTIALRACSDLGLHSFTIDGNDIVTDGGVGSDLKTASYLEARAERAMNCGPEFCALIIRHIESLTADRMATTLEHVLAGARVLIATTTEVDKIPDGIRGLFTHEFGMDAPDEWEREGILKSVLSDQGITLAPNVELSSIAVKTAALVAGDLVDVVDRALVARNERLEALALASSEPDNQIVIRDLLVAGGRAAYCLTKVDFDIAVETARKNFADTIGAPKIPSVSWDDVGGLANVKEAVMETIQLPLDHPELFARGLKKRSGILFYGPPGTGKTLLAKAIATEFSLNFFSVKGPELLNMYIGESEANVRRVFQRARDARPCVVFFDELDSVAPKRGNQGDSGGVMDRIVSQLLAELDGMSDGDDGGSGVFVIGATNRPDLLDAALLRPGRFDKMLYLGVSDTHEKQLTIMEALTRKFTLHPKLSLERVASKLPFTYTGADFYALCSDAMLKAVTRQASLVDSKVRNLNAERRKSGKSGMSVANFFDHYATDEDLAVMVTEDDFMSAGQELVSSVSAKELEHYKRVRAQFEKAEDPPLPVSDEDVTSKVLDDLPIGGPPKLSKGKGREPASNKKGKGKALRQWDEASEEEEKMVPINGYSIAINRKGKAVDMGFQDDNIENEDSLY